MAAEVQGPDPNPNLASNPAKAVLRSGLRIPGMPFRALAPNHAHAIKPPGATGVDPHNDARASHVGTLPDKKSGCGPAEPQGCAKLRWRHFTGHFVPVRATASVRGRVQGFALKLSVIWTIRHSYTDIGACLRQSARAFAGTWPIVCRNVMPGLLSCSHLTNDLMAVSG